MLYIVLAYLMLFAALSNVVCLHNAFFAIDFSKCFLFSCLVFVYGHIVFFFKYDFPSCAVLLIYWFFLIPCLRHFLYEWAM